MLILKRPWTRQPHGAAGLNPKWADKVLVAVSGSQKYDVRSGKTPATVGVDPGPAKPSLSGLAFEATGTGALEVQSPLIPTSVVGTALLFVGSFPIGATNFFGYGENAASGGFFALSFSGGVLAATYRGRAGGATTDRLTSIGGARSNVQICAVITAANNIVVYQSGYDIGTSPGSTGGTDNLLWSRFGLNALIRNTATYATAGVQIALAAAFRNISVVEAAALSQNPWDLFTPQQICIPTAAAAASGLPTLSASTFVPGSVTATGWRPRVTAEYA